MVHSPLAVKTDKTLEKQRKKILLFTEKWAQFWRNTHHISCSFFRSQEELKLIYVQEILSAWLYLLDSFISWKSNPHILRFLFRQMGVFCRMNAKKKEIWTKSYWVVIKHIKTKEMFFCRSGLLLFIIVNRSTGSYISVWHILTPHFLL